MVVFCLKEKHRRVRCSNRRVHHGLKRRRRAPAFGAARCIHRGTVRRARRAQNRLDTPEGIPGSGNAVFLNELLRPQPVQGSQLILQVIGLQQPGHGGSGFHAAAAPPGLGDLVADVRAGFGTEPLPPSVGHEEDPAFFGEQRAQAPAGLAVQHAGRTAVVVQNRRKGPVACWFEKFAGQVEAIVLEVNDLWLVGAARGTCEAHRQRDEKRQGDERRLHEGSRPGEIVGCPDRRFTVHGAAV